MKSIIKKFVHLPVMALLLTCLALGLPGSVRAGQDVPFHGVFRGVETITFMEFPIFRVEGSGAGTATHLGHFAMIYSLEGTDSTVPSQTSGVAVFTAANGDKVFTDFVGLGTLIGDTVSVVEVHTITGGTGRFERARGSFVRNELLDLITGITSNSIDGTIRIR